MVKLIEYDADIVVKEKALEAAVARLSDESDDE